MLCLNTLAEVADALSDPDLDPDLRRLLARRGWRFYGHPEHHPDARLIVIHPETNDTLRFNCLGVADRPPAAGKT